MEIKVEAKVLTTEVNTHIANLKLALTERLGAGWDANQVNHKIYDCIEKLDEWINEQDTIVE